MASRNREVGHSFEREIAKLLVESGFEDAATSRLCNRLRDSQKIDLCNKDESTHGRLPYNIQAKCMVGVIPYQKYLSEIPLTEGLINVVLHKKTLKSSTGKTFQTKERYAFMYQHDFFRMVKEIQELRGENEELRRRVDYLEEENTKLENQSY